MRGHGHTPLAWRAASTLRSQRAILSIDHEAWSWAPAEPRAAAAPRGARRASGGPGLARPGTSSARRSRAIRRRSAPHRPRALRSSHATAASVAGTDDWESGHHLEFRDVVREFLQASRRAEQRELETANRRSRRLRAVVIGRAALLVVSAGATIVALDKTADARSQQRVARLQARVATSRQLVAGQHDVEGRAETSICPSPCKRSASPTPPMPAGRYSPLSSVARGSEPSSPDRKARAMLLPVPMAACRFRGSRRRGG